VEFQQKCLGRLNSVARAGRTVLFVSHNMAAVQSLCSRAVLLERGGVVAAGATASVVDAHVKMGMASAAVPLGERHDRAGDGTARLTRLAIESTDASGVIRPEHGLRVRLHYEGPAALRRPTFIVGIYDSAHTRIYALRSDGDAHALRDLPAAGAVDVVTDRINLTPGTCYVNVALLSGDRLADHVEHAGAFDVAAPQQRLSGATPDRGWALCTVGHRWSASTS
jgi:lipopolysaccharide transport system ATP-binding protein